jgi:hypothetical protein
MTTPRLDRGGCHRKSDGPVTRPAHAVHSRPQPDRGAAPNDLLREATGDQSEVDDAGHR